MPATRGSSRDLLRLLATPGDRRKRARIKNTQWTRQRDDAFLGAHRKLPRVVTSDHSSHHFLIFLPVVVSSGHPVLLPRVPKMSRDYGRMRRDGPVGQCEHPSSDAVSVGPSVVWTTAVPRPSASLATSRDPVLDRLAETTLLQAHATNFLQVLRPVATVDVNFLTSVPARDQFSTVRLAQSSRLCLEIFGDRSSKSAWGEPGAIVLLVCHHEHA